MKHEIIKISLNAIEKTLGRGNFDDMENLLWDILSDTLPSNAIHADMIHFIDLDTEHENPYFHHMAVCLVGVDLATIDLVKNALRKRNLLLD